MVLLVSLVLWCHFPCLLSCKDSYTAYKQQHLDLLIKTVACTCLCIVHVSSVAQNHQTLFFQIAPTSAKQVGRMHVRDRRLHLHIFIVLLSYYLTVQTWYHGNASNTWDSLTQKTNYLIFGLIQQPNKSWWLPGGNRGTKAHYHLHWMTESTGEQG